MARSSLALINLLFVFLLLSFKCGFCIDAVVNETSYGGQVNPNPYLNPGSVCPPLGKTWCVAKPSTPSSELMANLEYACHEVNCMGLIDPGYSCYEPATDISRASVVMNLYYQSRGRNWWNCDFKSTGLIVITDPSYGSCMYA